MTRLRNLALLTLGALLAACGGEAEPPPVEPHVPVSQRPADTGRDFVAGLRRARRLPEHASDRGGRVRLLDEPGEPGYATSDVPRRFRLVYEAGPEGIAVGGAVYLQLSPYWGWQAPQLRDVQGEGYTTITGSAPDLGLQSRAIEPKTVRVRITGRALAAGETITFAYGAGPAGAAARYAEKRASFRFAVDGNGDGSYAYLDEVPSFEVRPGPAATLAVTLPATARPGETVHVTVAALDARRNAIESLVGDFAFHDLPAALETPDRFTMDASDRGRARLSAVARTPGIVRLRVDGPDGLRGWSNPMLVSDGPRVLWGDLHGHTAFSDGTGTPEDYFRFARDVAGLDVSALTDHDAWGPVPLDRAPDHWEVIQEVTKRFHAPGRFVTILGYEWTNWEHGHRHVLYFEDRGEVLSALDPAFDTPPLLWKELANKPALTFAHHSAGGPVATNWDFAPDPTLEPVTEISSVHGSSEASDSPLPVEPAIAGNFVRDALDRGYALGFIGSGDSHDGHPGAVPQGRPPGGLAGILAENVTRDDVLEALRARRVYATNGARIVLYVTLGGHPMGASLPVPSGGTRDEDLAVEVVAPRNLDRVDVIRSGQVVDSIAVPARSAELSFRRPIEGLAAGEYLYVRAVQSDGGVAWSSPFFLAAE
jgi:hypothetical protein